MANFTKLNETLTAEVSKNKYSADYYHTLKLYATLNSIDTNNLTANVTLKCNLISRYLAWGNDTIIFRLLANDKILKKKNGDDAEARPTSGGDKNSNLEVNYVTWTGDFVYNADGTLNMTLAASSSDNNGAASPPNQTASLNVTFPIITIANAYVKNGDEMKLAEAHILKNGQFVPCAVYQKQGNEFVEINLNKANLAK